MAPNATEAKAASLTRPPRFPDVPNLTLVSKEMRGAYHLAKEELVTRLLVKRSPRMAKVLATIGPGGNRPGADQIENVFSRTVAVEKQAEPGVTLSEAEPTIVPSDIVMSVSIEAIGSPGAWLHAWS